MKYISERNLEEEKINLNAFFRFLIYSFNLFDSVVLVLCSSLSFVVSTGTGLNKCAKSSEINTHNKHKIIGMFGFIVYKNPDATLVPASNR